VFFSLDALQIGADDPRGPFTVTGGLPYAGGPGSCYDIGAAAAMADVLVDDPGYGMLTGVGMHLSKHAAVVLSTEPGEARSAVEPTVGPAPRKIVDEADGAGTVAAYTVLHASDGTATDGLFICDLDPDSRCYAKTADVDFLTELEATEWVGRTVHLDHQGGVNRAHA
jgi:acetyl-CoA C-acetyltransferase